MSKKIIALIVFIFLVAGLGLTVYLSQQQQQITSRATPATTLSILPATDTKQINETFTSNVNISTGENSVASVELYLKFNPEVLEAVDITAGSFFTNPAQLEKTIDNTGGNITYKFYFLDMAGKQGDGALASITFKGKAEGTSNVTIESNSIVAAVSDSDVGENVLTSRIPATYTISSTSVSPSISPLVSPSVTSIPSSTLTPTATASAGTANLAPICTDLSVDRAASGTAPFSITFTANGRDSDGTVNKVTFDFGDGSTQDLFAGGGLTSNTVSILIAHTYNNTGTYTAKAVFTDNRSAISGLLECTKVITVTTASSGSNGSVGGQSTSPIQVTNIKTGETIRNIRPTFRGIAASGARISITINSNTITGSTYADASGAWSWTPTENLELGAHSASFVATDTKGNTTTTSISFNITNTVAQAQPGSFSTTIFIAGIALVNILAGIFFLKGAKF